MKAKEIYLHYVWNKIKSLPHLECYVGQSNSVHVCDSAHIQDKRDYQGTINDYETFENYMNLRGGVTIFGFMDTASLFKELYLSTTQRERKTLLDLVNQLYISDDFLLKFLKNMGAELNEKDLAQLWINIPSKAIRFTYFKFDLKKFLNLIDEQFPQTKEELVFEFIRNHAKILAREEKRATLVRDCLIERYDFKNLEKYASLFPMVAQYLANHTDNTNSQELDIFEKGFIKEILYVEINVSRLKGQAYIPQWKTEKYMSALKSLFDILYKKHEEIREIKLNKCREEDEYFSIVINKKQATGITQNEIEYLIVKFFQELTRVYCDYPWKKEEAEKFILLWLEKLSLSEKLTHKAEKKVIQKI